MNKKLSLLLVGLMGFFGLFQLVLAETGDLPQIIIDPETGKITITDGYFENVNDEDETENSTGTVETDTNTGTTTEVEEIVVETGTVETETNTGTTTETSGLSEYEQAIAWMYANGLTMYSDPVEYRPDDFTTRQQAAKIIGQLYATLGYSQVQTNTACDFADEDEFNPTLSAHIRNVCEWGLFKGAEGKYYPTDFLTKPQAMAVLMRMFESKVSDETRDPWWELYYLKGWRIGIIGSDETMSDYDQRITRKELALYVYRLKNIVENEQLKTMGLNATNQVDSEYSDYSDSNLTTNLSALAGSIDASQDPELQEAIAWMHDEGLTIHSTVADYSPFDVLTREQAAKMLDKFADLFNLKTTPSYIGNECNFTDMDEANPSLVEHITNVCEYGYMRGGNGVFGPQEVLSKSQFVVALIRMLEGPQDQTMDPWWTKYYERANALGIVGPADAVTFDNSITRYEVALFFYRLKVKYQLLQSLNTNKLQNEIISTVEGSEFENLEGGQEANIYISSNYLNDANFEIGYIEIFGTRYKVVKTDSVSYFSNSFVRYGDLYSLEDDSKVGTVSFSLTNGIVVDGTIRNSVEATNYKISALSSTSAYYKIRELVQ